MHTRHAATWLVAATLTLFALASSHAQEPRWGERLVVRYDPALPGATLDRSDAVHLVAWVHRPDRIDTVAWPMTLEDGVFRREIPIDEGVSYLTLYYVSPSAWDPQATAGVQVFDRKGRPAPGAYHHGMEADFEHDFAREIELYPDSPWAYFRYWQLLRRNGGEWKSRVRSDLALLDARAEGRPADYLYAASGGRMMLGEEPAARKLIAALMKRHPTSPFVALAVSQYQYEVFAQQIGRNGPQAMDKLIGESVRRHPETALARRSLRDLARRDGYPVEVLQKVHDAWIRDEPEHPMPYLGLGEALHERGRDGARAAELISHAIDLLLAGQLRFHGDISGKEAAMTLPFAYRTLAALEASRGLHGRALAALRASQSLDKAPGEALLDEGRLWESLDDPRRAEAAYRQAWHHAPLETEPLLLALYERRHGSLEGFEATLRDTAEAEAAAAAATVTSETDGPLDTEPVGAAAAAADGGPAFEITTVDGLTLSLDQLRGNAVVLNFWFQGCAPCIVEIPALNRLVREFEGQPVVFLSLSLDTVDAVRDFLTEHEFLYLAVGDSGELHEAFDVEGYPTHVLIDRDGAIQHVLQGGDASVDQRMQPLIDRLVR